MMGTAAATLPTSSSVCMIFFTLAYKKNEKKNAQINKKHSFPYWYHTHVVSENWLLKNLVKSAK